MSPSQTSEQSACRPNVPAPLILGSVAAKDQRRCTSVAETEVEQNNVCGGCDPCACPPPGASPASVPPRGLQSVGIAKLSFPLWECDAPPAAAQILFHGKSGYTLQSTSSPFTVSLTGSDPITQNVDDIILYVDLDHLFERWQ